MHIDLVGPLPPPKGYRYLSTIIDSFAHWPEAIPLPGMMAETVASVFVTTSVAWCGTRDDIAIIRSRKFKSAPFRNLLCVLRTTRPQTTAYHPQANELIEGFHR